MNAVAETEIARYVDAVRAELSDLSPRERDDLLEDLPDHLAEVAAEGGGSLEDRLGSPAAYAAELRASAGLRARPALGDEETFAQRMTNIAGEVRRRLRQADTKAGPVLGYGTASEFVRLLRPAWWVLRGYIVAMLLALLLDATSEPVGLLPRVGDSDVADVAALVVLAVCIVASIWLGRRTDRLGVWPKRVVLAGGAIVLLFGFVGFVEADQRNRWTDGGYETVYSNPYEHIQDVYVYDEQGQLVENARLFDQNGQPIQLGNVYCLDAPSDFTVDGIPPYPRCPGRAPFNLPPLAVTPEPTAPEPTAEPSPSVTTPSDVATPSPTPR